MFTWYKNQSIDLPSESMDWFLYNGNVDFEWIKADISVKG